jgi:hypothetical protein
MTNQFAKEHSMTRASVFAAIAFLAGLAVGLFARGGAAPQPKTHDADLAAIEKLHKADVDSTLTRIRRR